MGLLLFSYIVVIFQYKYVSLSCDGCMCANLLEVNKMFIQERQTDLTSRYIMRSKLLYVYT